MDLLIAQTTRQAFQWLNWHPAKQQTDKTNICSGFRTDPYSIWPLPLQRKQEVFFNPWNTTKRKKSLPWHAVSKAFELPKQPRARKTQRRHRLTSCQRPNSRIIKANIQRPSVYPENKPIISPNILNINGNMFVCAALSEEPHSKSRHRLHTVKDTNYWM